MLRFAVAGAWIFALASLPCSQLAMASARDHYQLLDCERLPGEAVLQLPAPAQQWARIDCRPFGQTLAQPPGYTWRYSGTFTREVIVAAIMGKTAEEGGGARYFRDASVASREGAQVADLHRTLQQQVSSYAFLSGDEVPQAAHTLRLVNDVLDIITVHFMQRAGGDMWAVVCTPECMPENVFVIQKLRG
jgi:hypothetical protein